MRERETSKSLLLFLDSVTVYTGMSPDYLPRISSPNCGYPFTFLGGLYHSCLENMENVSSVCERWGCFEVNYTGAVCAANIGRLKTSRNPSQFTTQCIQNWQNPYAVYGV